MPRRHPRRVLNLWLRGRSWYLEFQVKGVRYGPKSLGPISREAAERMAAEAHRAVLEGEYHRPPVPTFGRFAEDFLRWYLVGHRPGSVRRYGHVLLRLVDRWGDVPLDAITPLMLEGYKRERAAVSKPRTVNTELTLLTQLYRRAIDWGHLSRNPMATVHHLRTDEARTRVLSLEEEQRLLDACIPRLRALVQFALHTGLRRQELVTLTWAQIDRRRATVTVESVTAKSRRARTIPLNTAALQALAQADSRDGRVFGYRDCDRSLRLVCRRLGWTDVSAHVLRHTFASRCVEAGMDLRSLQLLLGHASLLQTQRYVHPSPAHLRQGVERLVRQNFPQDEGVVPDIPLEWRA